MEESKKDDKISLYDLVHILLLNRRKIFIVFLSCSFFGLFFSFLMPKSYTSSSTFVTSYSSNNTGSSIKGLASLAGLNLNSQMDGYELPTEIFPKIVESVSFRFALLSAEVNISESEKVSYKRYYENYYNVSFTEKAPGFILGIPHKIVGFFSDKSNIKEDYSFVENDEIIRLSELDRKHLTRIKDQLDINYSKEDGSIRLKFDMPEAIMSAQMAQSALELLQERLLDYKIKQMNTQLDFAEQLYKDKKAEFILSDKRLSEFNDENLVLTTETAKGEQRLLQFELDVAFNVYSEVAAELERIKLRVNQNAPVFVIIDPVTLPLYKQSPRRILMFLVYGFLGTIGYCLFQVMKLLISRSWIPSND